MERKIHKSIESTLKTFAPDLNQYLEELERDMEAELFETFYKIGIHSSVKTDKHSLPHQGEVVVKVGRDSYINAMFEGKEVYRKIIKEMLDKDARKIRYYMHIETYGSNGKCLSAFMNAGILYRFRYYIHEV